MIPCYLPLVRKHKNGPYGYHERQWQLVRRGHYAEFNLVQLNAINFAYTFEPKAFSFLKKVYDRGTKFGLYTPGARYESILMSLPLAAKWEYMHDIKAGTREEILTNVLKTPREWARE